MSKILDLQVTTDYGRKRIYPKNKTAELLLKLMNRTVFTPDDIPLLLALGYEINWVPSQI